MDADIARLLDDLTLDVLGPIIQLYSEPENPLIWVLTEGNIIMVHRYDLAAQTWSVIDQFRLPAGLNIHNQYVVDTMFYSANIDKITVLTTPFRYDIITRQLTTYPPIGSTFKVIKPAVIGSDVYILISDLGNINNNNEWYMYKLIGEMPNWRWVECTPPNGPWLNSEVTVAKNKLYMPFNIDKDQFNLVEMYDPNIDEWEILPPVESDYVTALTTLHDDLYVLVDTKEETLYKIQRYDDGKWITITQYRAPENYCGITMFGIGDLLYVKLEAVTIINVYNTVLDQWSVLEAPIKVEDEVFHIST